MYFETNISLGNRNCKFVEETSDSVQTQFKIDSKAKRI